MAFTSGPVCKRALTKGIAELKDFRALLRKGNFLTRFPNCPDIAAAYLEVVNTLWLFQMARGQGLETVDTSSLPEQHSALLRIQQAVMRCILASQSPGFLEALEGILIHSSLEADSLVRVVRLLPQLLFLCSTDKPSLAEISGFYINICMRTRAIEVRVAVLGNLSDVLSEIVLETDVDVLSPALLDLWTNLSLQAMNPGLSDAIIKASGNIIGLLWRVHKVSANGLREWGLMVAEAGLDSKVRDDMTMLGARFVVAGSRWS